MKDKQIASLHADSRLAMSGVSKGSSRRLCKDDHARVGRLWDNVKAVGREFARRYPRIDCDWQGELALALCREVDRLHSRTSWQVRQWAIGICLNRLVSRRPGGLWLAPRKRRLPAMKPIPMPQLFVTDGRTLEAVENREEIERMFSILSPTALQVMRAKYCDGFTNAEIAQSRNVTVGRVGQVVRESIHAIWNRFHDNPATC